ncbi:hypothetical protein [Streptomyces sp. NPDC002088]|uniref:hypothetical protein n=1 Tax=Streptomyces sp. NPDC002088 TaxID=3154665 RepID=UPI00331CA3BD
MTKYRTRTASTSSAYWRSRGRRWHTAITRVQQVNQALDCSLETETTQLINQLLNGPGTAARVVPEKREQFQVPMSTVRENPGNHEH